VVAPQAISQGDWVQGSRGTGLGFRVFESRGVKLGGGLSAGRLQQKEMRCVALVAQETSNWLPAGHTGLAQYSSNAHSSTPFRRERGGFFKHLQCIMHRCFIIRVAAPTPKMGVTLSVCKIY
jgi:hypothetical protein